jgi:hypothetical protein
VLNHAATGSPVVYLTHLGGGAFGNERAWIDAALRRALTLVRGFALDARVVSYGASGADIRRLVEEFAG